MSVYSFNDNFNSKGAVPMQRTIAKEVGLSGIGLHSGFEVDIKLKPAKVDSGIIFIRTDIDPECAIVHASWDTVIDTLMCTKVANDDGITVGTIEHLMAALYACEIDNVIIELNGPEVPVMDGSSKAFVEMIESVGTKILSKPKIIIEILKEVKVKDTDNRWVSFTPADDFSLDIQFTFGDRADLPDQSFKFNGCPKLFKSEITDARTFGFLQEVQMLWKSGLAKGGSLDNAVVLDHDGPLNAEGFRFPDECVRHKALDAIGDMYLAGGLFKGHFKGSQSGHSLLNRLLRALFADEDNYRIIEHTEPAEVMVGIISNQPAAKISAYATA